MENAELAFKSPVIAGKAVEVGDDGFFGEGLVAAAAGGEVFEIVEPIEAEVFDGEAIHDQLFLRGLRFVILMQGFLKAREDGAFAAVQVNEEKLVGGTKAVFKGVHARAGFASLSFGAGRVCVHN